VSRGLEAFHTEWQACHTPRMHTGQITVRLAACLVLLTLKSAVWVRDGTAQTRLNVSRSVMQQPSTVRKCFSVYTDKIGIYASEVQRFCLLSEKPERNESHCRNEHRHW
jgi:hypothetical protein